MNNTKPLLIACPDCEGAKCESCGYHGAIATDEGLALLSLYDSALEEMCRVCEGSGLNQEMPTWQCPYCSGKASVVTEAGKRLLDFLERRLKVNVEIGR